MTKEEIRDLILMIAEKDMPYPAPWSQVPDKYKEEFKGWVEEQKQQTWDGMWEKGWYNYHLEFLVHILTVILYRS